MKPENRKTSRRPTRFVSSSRPTASSSRTSPTAPAGGSDSPPELIYGLHAVREALRAGSRPLQRLLMLRTDRQFFDLAQLAKAQRVPVHIEPPPAFDRLVPGGHHQGVIALIAAKSYDTTEQILDRAKARGEKPFLVLLDGVEDPHNLGAVLRTAEAAGVHGVFIPERRAVGLTSVVAKVSAGALDHIAVGRVGNLIRLIQDLKRGRPVGLWRGPTGGEAPYRHRHDRPDRAGAWRGRGRSSPWCVGGVRRPHQDSDAGPCTVVECFSCSSCHAVRSGPPASQVCRAGGEAYRILIVPSWIAVLSS